MRAIWWFTALALWWAAPAMGDCLPEGRATFAAGLEALSRADLEEAHARFEELVKAQPKCTEARNNLAVVLFEMGRTQEADTQLRMAVEEDPDYQRARFNLRRVESGFRGEAVKPEIESAIAGDPTPFAPMLAPTFAPAATSPPVATARATVPPTRAAQAASSAPPQLAALEPIGATGCLIDAAQKQLCLYRRAEAGIVQDGCWPIVEAQTSSWPQWVTASDQTAQRIRLVDETHQRRLRIVPEGVTMDDSVRLRQRDFTALAGKVTAWRTGWVGLPPGGPALPAAIATQSATEVRDAVERWRQAWEGKQFEAYTALYGASFVPQPEKDATRWRARKRSLFAQAAAITVRLAALSIFVVSDGGTVITTFEQTYNSAGSESRDFKALRWQRQAGRWQISAETVLSARVSGRPARRRGE